MPVLCCRSNSPYERRVDAVSSPSKQSLRPDHRCPCPLLHGGPRKAPGIGHGSRCRDLADAWRRYSRLGSLYSKSDAQRNRAGAMIPKGTRYLSRPAGVSGWQWLMDVASNWTVAMIVIAWPRPTQADCRRIRSILMHGPSTGLFRWAVRIDGNHILVVRFALRPSLLQPADVLRPEARATFAPLVDLGWPGVTGPVHRSRMFEPIQTRKRK